MTINELGAGFQCDVDSETILALANKIDELVQTVNVQQRYIERYEREIRFLQNRANSLTEMCE